MFLDEDELLDLTGYCRRPSQQKALDFMGVVYKIRPDGSLAVLRAHVEKIFCVSAISKVPQRKGPQLEMAR